MSAAWRDTEVLVAPSLDRRDWALIAVAHGAIVALAAATPGDQLEGAALAQFLVSRVIGMGSFVGGAWLLVQALDRIQRLRTRAWRVLARVGAVHLLGLAALALAAPLILLAESLAGWSVPRTADDFAIQFEVNVLVFTVYAGVYWAWRRRRIAVLAQAQIVRADAALRDARLHALALELQPHFLHNALNSIAQLVRDDPAAAEGMLVALGDLLRDTLDSGRTTEHPLADELARLSLYLDLQRMRFGDRLQVHVDVPEAARAVLVPTMVLQPLVENALQHGIGRRPGPGTVALQATRVDTDAGPRLRLLVRDDGAGLVVDPPSLGVGLRNTRERLEVLHADRFLFSVEARPSGGVDVTLEFPWRTSAESSRDRAPGSAA